MTSLLLVALGAPLTACAVQPAGYMEAEFAPAYVETYPRAYYDGRYFYLVGDVWYTRRGDRWVYLRSEPQFLYRYRLGLRHRHVGRAYRATHRRHADEHLRRSYRSHSAKRRGYSDGSRNAPRSSYRWHDRAGGRKGARFRDEVDRRTVHRHVQRPSRHEAHFRDEVDRRTVHRHAPRSPHRGDRRHSDDHR